jgi:hypothetical protein
MFTAEELHYAPTLKINRAAHHLSNLKGKIETFLAQKPFKLMIRYKRKAGRVEAFSKTDIPIPACFALIIGDAIHNLRAALDLTLYSMAVDRSPSPDKIEFPFPRKPTGLGGALNSSQAIFAGTKVVETIRRFQPYPGGDPILCNIHFLDARDKHRLLILARHTPELSIGELAAERFNNLSRVKFVADGAIIRYVGDENSPVMSMGVRFATRDMADSEEEAATQCAFEIAFGKGQPFADFEVLGTLDGAVNKVKEVVAAMIEAYLSPDNLFPNA